jgi:cytochrome c-type biogenesis protein
VASALFVVRPAPAPLWRHPAFATTLALAGMAALAMPWWWPPVSVALTALEFGLAERLGGDGGLAGVAWFLLPLAGLGAGLVASVSPCILPLVPLQVAAIGAADATGRRALALSLRFVLGAALALTLLGLFGGLAGWLLVEQRGFVLLLAGAALIYLGLAFLDLAPLPLAGRDVAGGRRLGPIGAGAAFALVTTPCASPLLGGVLAAAVASGRPGLPAATMFGFALGYTALVLLAGVVGGTLVGRLQRRSFAGPRAASAAALLVAGGSLLWGGLRWL